MRRNRRRIRARGDAGRVRLEYLERREVLSAGPLVGESIASADQEWFEGTPTRVLGDVNLDGFFDGRDLVHVHLTGEYEAGRAGNSTWTDGDWDGDGECSSRDLILAFQQQSFVSAASAPNPVISEFVASNDRSLTDGNGDQPDWIEIFNGTGGDVSLAGWHLTDDPSRLSKWTFPQTKLAAGDYLVVFASGNDAVDPAGHLHTNFRLAAEGGYLALVKPDGATIATQFGSRTTQYPPQFADVAYGTTVETTKLIGPAVGIDVLLPTAETDATYGLTWTGGDERAFQNAGGLTHWQHGITGVGHKPADPLVEYQALVTGEPSLLSYYTFDNDTLQVGGIHDVAGSINRNGKLVCLTRYDSKGCTDHFAVGADGVSGKALSLHGGGYVELGAVPEFFFEDGTGTIEAWLLPEGAGGSWFGTRSEKAAIPGPANRYSLIMDYGQLYQSSTGVEPFRDATPFARDGWLHVVTVFDQGLTRFYVNGRAGRLEDLSGWGGLGPINSNVTSQIGITSFPNFVDSFRGKIDELAVYRDALDLATIAAHYQELAEPVDLKLGTNIAASMLNQSSSAYLRIPFTVDDPTGFSALQLTMQYNDGFVAYLNGVPVAQHNAPAQTGYQSRATAKHPVGQIERFNISGALSALKQGENVLAIHGMNLTPDDEFFYVLPELTATTQITAADLFLLTPTPGGPNAEHGVLDLVRPVSIDRPHGFYEQGFDVQMTTVTPGATIVYTTDGSPPSLQNGTVVPAASATLAPVARLHVDQTTNLLAAAFKPDWQPSAVSAATYLFLRNMADIERLGERIPQTPATARFSFELDPEIINDPRYAGELIDDFKALPAMSLTVDPDQFFGPGGIYVNPGGRGQEAEIPVSLEYFTPGENDGFQINAGIRMHGRAARGFPKLHMRVSFRTEFGADKLRYPLFDDSLVESFDTLILRTGGHDSWVAGVRPTLSYVRERFLFDSSLAMGQPNPHSRFVHLFINGRYWGVYYPTEHPDADFAASYLGGNDDDWDVLKSPTGNGPPVVDRGDNVAWNELMAIAEGGLASDEAYMQVNERVDIDSFIDHMIVKMWGATQDWGGFKNYFMARNRNGGKFVFFNWDSDFAMGNMGRDVQSNLTGIDAQDSPARLYARLRENAEFCLRFADRVQKYLFNDGPLTTSNSLARFDQIVAALNGPIVLESARWGDELKEPPSTREGDWQADIDWLRNDFLAVRSDIQVQQFRDAGLYPAVESPQFSVNGVAQHGGTIAAGDRVSINAEADATIYYTIDGIDPRQAGGAVAEDARVFTGDFLLPESTRVQARAKRGEMWSAVSEALFSVTLPAADSSNLRVSEIQYNPARPSPAEQVAGFTDNEEFEFVELVNISDAAIDLRNVQLVEITVNGDPEGIAFDFATANIARLGPGERAVVVENIAAFQARYGSAIPLAGQWSGRLSNSGESLTLLGGETIIQQFAYRDSWYPETDGDGYSLEVVDPTDPVLANWARKSSWRPSLQIGGTPGQGTSPRGDFSGNGSIGAEDIDALFGAIQSQTNPSAYDLTGDRRVDFDDAIELVEGILQTSFGDADVDGLFNSSDIVRVLQAGEYEDTLVGNSTWADGDWNGDGEFTSDDIVLAFQRGNFAQQAVRRPTSLATLR